MGETQNALDAYKKTFMEKAPKQKQADYELGIAAVKKSGVESNAVGVGDIAPSFVVQDINDETFSLEEKLAIGPVVLVWYRGGWCPYCNIYLNEIKKIIDEAKLANATLVAITPELANYAKDTAKEKDIHFSVISDVNNVIAKQFKIVYKLPDYVSEYYKSFKVDERNGNESKELPLSATYVIGKDRVVMFAFLDADYRKRAELSDIEKALRGKGV